MWRLLHLKEDQAIPDLSLEDVLNDLHEDLWHSVTLPIQGGAPQMMPVVLNTGRTFRRGDRVVLVRVHQVSGTVAVDFSEVGQFIQVEG